MLREKQLFRYRRTGSWLRFSLKPVASVFLQLDFHLLLVANSVPEIQCSLEADLLVHSNTDINYKTWEELHTITDSIRITHHYT
jgi:hypothetical protein